MDKNYKTKIIVTKRHKVSCDGEEDNINGHPLVYLEIDEEKKETVCPYCSKKFVLQ